MKLSRKFACSAVLTAGLASQCSEEVLDLEAEAAGQLPAIMATDKLKKDFVGKERSFYLERLKGAIHSQPEDQALFTLAQRLEAEGDIRAASAVYELMFRGRPDNYTLYLWIKLKENGSFSENPLRSGEERLTGWLEDFNQVITFKDPEADKVRQWAREALNERASQPYEILERTEEARQKLATESPEILDAKMKYEEKERWGTHSSTLRRAFEFQIKETPQWLISAAHLTDNYVLAQDAFLDRAKKHQEQGDWDEATRLFVEGAYSTAKAAQVLGMACPDLDTCVEAGELAIAEGDHVGGARYFALAKTFADDPETQDEFTRMESEAWYEEGRRQWICGSFDNLEAERNFRIGGWQVDRDQTDIECYEANGNPYTGNREDALIGLYANGGGCDRVQALAMDQMSRLAWSTKTWRHLFELRIDGISHYDIPQWFKDGTLGDREWTDLDFDLNFGQPFEKVEMYEGYYAAMAVCLAQQESRRNY